MEVIQSGTTVERLVRTGLMTALTVGFSAAFLYDGYVGYPRENATNLMKSLGLESADPPVINSKVTANEAGRVTRAIKDGDATSPVGVFGEPSFTHETFAYFVGPGGHLRVKILGESFQSPAWRAAGHTEPDLLWQGGLGFTLGAVGMMLIVQFIRVATTKVVLSGEGLKVRGRALIPFSAITKLGSDQFEKTGQLVVEYSLEGREGSVRLESYVVKRLPDIQQALQEKLDAMAGTEDSPPCDPCSVEKASASQ